MLFNYEENEERRPKRHSVCFSKSHFSFPTIPVMNFVMKIFLLGNVIGKKYNFDL